MYSKCRRCFSSLKHRTGFGSFHSEDVELLIRQQDSAYCKPRVFDTVEANFSDSLKALDSCVFGTDIRSRLFNLSPDWTFLNHGAFGGSLKLLLSEAEWWRRYCEEQPLRFFDRVLLPCIAYNIRIMAKHLKCPSTELIPLPNVTTGMNVIVNSVQIEQGDDLICLSLSYGSTKKILRNLALRKGANLIIVNIPLPVTSAALMTSFEQSLTNKTKLVIIDEITSNTGLNLPVEKMSLLAKAVGAIVVVDAAHSLYSLKTQIYKSGSVLDVDTQQPLYELEGSIDAWISNGHKWLCTPKGCAYMWVSSNLRQSLRPSILSHGFISNVKNSIESVYSDPSKILSSFVWDGCRDYSAILTTASALRFWESALPELLVPNKDKQSHELPLGPANHVLR